MKYCLVIDDEPLAQDVLVSYIEKIPELKLVRTCKNAMEAFEILNKEKIDLLFLDIEMPVISGLGFLKSLQHPPQVIFTTAYPQHAAESYDLNAVDYLLKPISFERFLKAVQKIIVKSDSRSKTGDEKMDYIFVKVDYKLVKVNFSEILFVEGMKDYLKIHTRDKRLVVHQTMKSIEEDLPAKLFQRVHKSYIVSLPAVKSIEGNTIEIGNEKIPVGPAYKDALLKWIPKSSSE